MKHILSTITALFIILTSLVSWSESITMDDLVERNELYYKKFTDNPFTGEISGIENGSFKNGKMNGEWLRYYENGQLNEKVNFKDGKRDGLSETYFENGQLKDKGNYKDGKEEGLWEAYFENGQLFGKANFKDGKRNGLLENYYRNGQLLGKGNYKDGKADGFSKTDAITGHSPFHDEEDYRKQGAELLKLINQNAQKKMA